MSFWVCFVSFKFNKLFLNCCPPTPTEWGNEISTHAPIQKFSSFCLFSLLVICLSHSNDGFTVYFHTYLATPSNMSLPKGILKQGSLTRFIPGTFSFILQTGFKSCFLSFTAIYGLLSLVFLTNSSLNVLSHGCMTAVLPDCSVNSSLLQFWTLTPLSHE